MRQNDASHCRLVPPLRRMTLYECQNFLYLVAFCENDGPTKFLRIDRTQGDKLALRHESKAAGAETKKWVEKIERIESPESVSVVHGVLGLQKLGGAWYLYVINKGHKVGQLRGSYVYALEKYSLVRVCSKSKVGSEEQRLRTLLERQLDLTKEFYYSYGYDLTRSLQSNSSVLRQAAREGGCTYRANDMFIWNAFLLRPLLKWLCGPMAAQQGARSEEWLLPLVHGYFKQRTLQLATSQVLRVTLLGRRSRHFAGTRLLKRGVNQRGFVANEVESEQMVSLDASVGCPLAAHCAIVQVRGSIPLFWSHPNLMAPKPDILLHDHDPHFHATKRHFDRLMSRYGRHVCILNLVRQMEKKPKESLLATRFAEAVGYLNALYEQEQGPSTSSSNNSSNNNRGPPPTPTPPPPTATSTQAAQGMAEQAPLPSTEAAQGGDQGEEEGACTLGAPIQEGGGGGDGDVSQPSALPSLQPPARLYIPPAEGAVPTHPSILNDGPVGVEGGGCGYVPLDYVSYDFLASMKRGEEGGSGKGSEVFDALFQIAEALLPSIGLFVDLGLGTETAHSEQVGVLRTNCIDCMDRTNVANFCFGRVCLVPQLEQLGVRLPGGALSEVGKVVMDLWAEHGDCIANQYGGSGAMHRVEEGEGAVAGQRDLMLTGGAKNALVAVQRYYSNNVTDYERQQAMDLFLGVSSSVPLPSPTPPSPQGPTASPTRPAAPKTPPASATASATTTRAGVTVAAPGATSTVEPAKPTLPLPLTNELRLLEKDEAAPPALVEEGGGEEGGGDLVLLRRVCVSKGNGPFSHEAHTQASLTSFDSLTAYDFDSPIVRNLAFEYVPLAERRPVGAFSKLGLFNGPLNGPPGPHHARGNHSVTALNAPDGPSELSSSGRGRIKGGQRERVKGGAEELYERYLAFELTLSNPLLVAPPGRPQAAFVSPHDHTHYNHHHHHRQHHHARHKGEGEYGDYVASMATAERLCDEAMGLVESTHLPVNRQRGRGERGRRRRHSFDDLLALTREGVTSFDEVLGKGGGEGSREGARGEEKGVKAAGTTVDVNVGGAVSSGTPSAAGGKAGEVGSGGEKGAEGGEKGLQLHRQIGSWLRRLGGQPANAPADTNNAAITLPPVKLPSVPEAPTKPEGPTNKPTPPLAPSGGDTASGKTAAPATASATANATASSLPPPPLLAVPTPIGQSDPSPSVVVGEMVTGEERVGERECRALRGALEAVKQQQEALLRLLARAEERERGHQGDWARADRHNF